MSPSELAPTRIDRSLVVTGPPGVELQILDGRYNLIGRGADRLSAKLRRGLYVARWVTADRVEDQIVDLVESRSGVAKFPAALMARSSVGLTGAGPKTRRRTRSAAVVVLEQCRDPNVDAAARTDVRLYNDGDVAMRSRSRAVETGREKTGTDERTGADWAVRVYPVNPGLYRLRYKTLDGEVVDQVVPAMRGRRTIVLLRLVTGQTLVNQGGAAAMMTRQGADPALTVIISTSQARNAPPDPEHVLLAESLLEGVAGGRGRLTRSTLDRLAGIRQDPLLKLYAAAGILAALRNGRPPGFEAPRDVSGPRAETAAWRREARSLLAGMPAAVAPIPDVALCRRELGLGRGRRLEALPMLATSLETLSIDERRLGLPGEGRTTAQAPDTTGPWIVRSASATKSGAVTSRLPPPPRRVTPSVWVAWFLLPVMGALVWRLWGAVDLDQVDRIALAVVPTVLTLAAGALTVVSLNMTAKATAEFSTYRARARSRLDAVPLWLPGRDSVRNTLRRRAVSAAPPFLLRPILFPDDANKGRFGGLAARDGFRLTAAFAETGDPDWVEIRLTVIAERGAERRRKARVHFFLHDSFEKSEVSVPMTKGRADLVIQGYGGFTVGVWMPDRQVELELDLAELPDAPRVIKDW